MVLICWFTFQVKKLCSPRQKMGAVSEIVYSRNYCWQWQAWFPASHVVHAHTQACNWYSQYQHSHKNVCNITSCFKHLTLKITSKNTYTSHGHRDAPGASMHSASSAIEKLPQKGAGRLLCLCCSGTVWSHNALFLLYWKSFLGALQFLHNCDMRWVWSCKGKHTKSTAREGN